MLALWAAYAQCEVVDRVRWIVGSRIITQSDVEFEREFDVHDVSPIEALDDPDYAIEARLVDFAVLRELAGDVEVYRPSAAEVRARLDAVRTTWARPADYAVFCTRWGLDEERLLGWLFSRLVVERYVLRNVVASGDEAWRAWISEIRGRAVIRSVS